MYYFLAINNYLYNNAIRKSHYNIILSWPSGVLTINNEKTAY